MNKLQESVCFQKAITLIDEENQLDPRQETSEQGSFGFEYLYSDHVTRWMYRITDNPGESLLLAARAIHIRRWEKPRNTFPMDRLGYRQWRRTLALFHADITKDILRQTGYGEQTITEVTDLITKKHFPKHPDSQILEDALTLVFLETQLSDFIQKTDHDKVIGVIQKTWKKMSDQAHTLAMDIAYDPNTKTILTTALNKE